MVAFRGILGGVVYWKAELSVIYYFWPRWDCPGILVHTLPVSITILGVWTFDEQAPIFREGQGTQVRRPTITQTGFT